MSPRAASERPVASAPPAATYRLQFRRGFTFRDAERLVPYLHDLGVSHVYCSPYLKARAGSSHGYDIVDHNALDPEVGDEEAFESFVAALRRHGMGQILDFVPNHAGIGSDENAWWRDVLEYGRASPFAGFFDIDWEPSASGLRGRVLLPFLGDHYGEALERGELGLAFDAELGAFRVSYHEHRFPIRPRDYGRILGPSLAALEERLGSQHGIAVALRDLQKTFEGLPPPSASARAHASSRERAEHAKRGLADLAAEEPAAATYLEETARAFAGKPGEPRSFEALHRLLEAQHYRLAYWRVAADEINYRRFFDINELAGLRVERADCFERVHGLVFRWLKEGKLDGLRIDHVDGLLDPRRYCERLRERIPDLYLVVEKILAPHERLRADWLVEGTTGYEFLNLVSGLLVDGEAKGALDRIYHEFSGRTLVFEDERYRSKKHVMNFLLGSEHHVLAHRLKRLAEASWRTRDFTETSLREALKEIVACFPVYRSYADERGARDEDRREIDAALRAAWERSSDPEQSVFDWIGGLLLMDLQRRDAQLYRRRDVVDFAMRFQQYTAPVVAKGLEDTSFYRYYRLVSLNEVGGDPRRCGVSLEEFHRANRTRAVSWPFAMLTTATHDTKRGEDVRARIDVISEIADEWESHVLRWAALNEPLKRPVGSGPAPTRNDEYLLYQTLLGSWPGEAPAEFDLSDYIERIETYMRKAVREGKESSSWRHPQTGYEDALRSFIQGILAPGSAFRADFEPLATRIAAYGALNGLSQLALKLTAPGVSDVYQGCELWDLSLVDPDNRRPVDFEHRVRLLDGLRREFGETPGSAPGDASMLVRSWRDGRLKLLVTWRLLTFRRRNQELFLRGDYVPLEVRGEQAGNVCAFARKLGRAQLIVAVPRLCAGLSRPAGGPFPVGPVAWGDTALRCPDAVEAALRDVVTGRRLSPSRREGVVELSAADLFADLPVAAVDASPEPGG
jgi:(1->4)-alpha-D-glucan 1-alpha-D-glucosylmutase